MNNQKVIYLDGTEYEIGKWIWENLIPKSDQSEWVQGEVFRAIERLREEAQGNGNINWDDRFEMFVDYIGAVLLEENKFSRKDKAIISTDLARLRNFITPDKLTSQNQSDQLPYVNDDLYDRLDHYLIEYCRYHPELIPKVHDPKQYR